MISLNSDKFVACNYRLKFQTLTHLNRTTTRGGFYKSYRRHVSSSTLLYGSRDQNLKYVIRYKSDYNWPVDGFFISPATFEKEFLSLGSEISTRDYNLIDPMSGILNSSVFGSKGSTYSTTKLYGSLKNIVMDAVDAGFLKESDVYKIKKDGSRGTTDWVKTHEKPKKHMKLCMDAVYHILEEECPKALSSRNINIEAAYKILDKNYQSGPLPGLLKIEQMVEQMPDTVKSSLSNDDQKIIRKLQEKYGKVSDDIMSDLMLYIYSWDSYASNHSKNGLVTIANRGSNDPVPNYGSIQFINPGIEMTGILICKKEDQEKVRQRFSKLFAIGTFANTNEVSVFLDEFHEVEVSEVSSAQTCTLQYPREMIPRGLDVKEVVESTNRYLIVRGEYSGKAFIIGDQCIPYDNFFQMQFGKKVELKTDKVIL